MADPNTAYDEWNEGLEKWNTSKAGILINQLANTGSQAAGSPVGAAGYAQGLIRYSSAVYSILKGLPGLGVNHWSNHLGPKKVSDFVTLNFPTFQEYGLNDAAAIFHHIEWYAKSHGDMRDEMLAAGALDYVQKMNPTFQKKTLPPPRVRRLQPVLTRLALWLTQPLPQPYPVQP